MTRLGTTTTLPLRVALITALALAASLSCRGNKKSTGPDDTGTTTAPTSQTDLAFVQDGDVPPGLAIRLSDGETGAPAGRSVPLAKAKRVSDRDADSLLARMKPLVKQAGDDKDFALRDKSLPPPRTGETIDGAFPPPGGAGGPPPATTNDKNEPLEVRRWAPEGEVPIAPHLSITFTQPMVAVTSHDDSVKDGVPVKLTPQPPGNWRWVGTKTLLFDPEVRFPQATTYEVEIRKGTKSATGNVLDETKKWTFSTPAPRMISSFPTYGPQKLDPLIFIEFDQRIDPKAILDVVQVKAGKKTFTVRAATDAEIEGDARIKSLADGAEQREHAGRYVVFRTNELLPKDTNVVVTLPAGTPSAEGPRKTKSSQSFSFKTFPPLRLVEARCGWNNNCPPMYPFYFRFNNPLDAEAFDPGAIAVEPEIKGMKVDLYGNGFQIRGATEGRTKYTVTIPASLRDTFDQTLGKDITKKFQVGEAQPSMWGPTGMFVLDPKVEKPTWDIFSINYPKVLVQLYQVSADDWPKWINYMRNGYDYRSKSWRTPPGKRVFDETIGIAAMTDKLVETGIDLSPALSEGRGHVIAIAEPRPWKNKRNRPPRMMAWIQATDLALDASVDSHELYAWASNLADGSTRAGVPVELRPHGKKARTNDDGMVRFELGNQQKGPAYLVARHEGDVAFLPENSYGDYTSWKRQDQHARLQWYVFDDRKMYRPGETVSVKGWIRSIDFGEGGDVGSAGALKTVDYQVFGPRGNEITKGKTKVNALGGFDMSFELPGTPNLGWARIQMTANGRAASGYGRSYSHGFQIQEFRRPEFEVNASASQGPHVVGSHADLSVKASYYAGGGLPNADVNWNVQTSPGSFTPPNRGDYSFGVWIPWWRSYNQYGYNTGNELHGHAQHKGKTDAVGTHVLRVDFLSVNPPRPMNVSAQATVMDVNRQAWTSSTSVLVHPSDYYVGLKSEKIFVEKGEPIDVDAIVVDHDGEAIEGKTITMRAVRIDYTYKAGTYEETEENPQDCVVTSTDEDAQCSFETEEGGRYRIRAVVVDDAGRKNETELSIWVAGGRMPLARDVSMEEVNLVPNAKEYAPGEKAKILVQSPFSPAQGLMTLRRAGIVSTERFEMTGPTTTLEVPIADAHTPNVYVQIDLIGAAERLDDDGEPNPKLPKRPAIATGQLNLPVPPKHRELTVDVKPREKKIEPGGSTTLDLRVRDARGKPVKGAELAVVVVDESVLSLTNYQLANPLDFFYPQRGAGARDHHLRPSVRLARPDEALLGASSGSGTGSGYGRGGGGGGGGEAEAMSADDDREFAAPAEPAPPPAATKAPTRRRARNGHGNKGALGGAAQSAQAPTPIAVRADFSALAVFSPSVRTNGSGKAKVRVKVPDNLTRYRVMVAAVAGETHYGKGESSVTARMPLMVRPSPPRFLNFGDRFELPVVVQNQTDRDMEVTVAVRSTNAAITAGRGRRMKVPANDRREVRFPAAAELAGTARFQVAASSGRWADAAEFSLPVWTPATTEAFATYGEVDKGAIRQPVKMPGDVVKQYGGLEITTSSTQMQALTDAFVYLVAYPYECAEQVSSRVLAVAALRDVITEFEAEGLPEPAEIEAAVVRDIEKLKQLQNPDGGWGFWYRGQTSWPWVSIHAANALARAKDKGYEIPAGVISRSLSYLKTIEQRIPHYYPIETRRTIISYALYTRKLLGDVDVARARKLVNEAGLSKLSLEAIGWLLGTMTGDTSTAKLRRKIHRHLDNKVTETAATAHFATSYSDGAHLILHSSRRADGVVLESLIEDKPNSDLIPKVVRGLLAHRTRGRWGNTQENAFVLLALDRYFNVFEKVTPNFVARAWLGDRYAGQHEFKGRTTERHHIDIPMRYLADGKAGDVILQKKGRGRMYYRIGMTYAPASLELEPADHGFAVERIYEPVDDPKDVVRQSNGTWKIKAGARVRVRLTMVAEARRYHVALVDPLPAGLEPMNPALAVTGEVPADPKAKNTGGRYWWWQRTWYEHQNMRDERVEAFTSLLWGGVYEYTYVARATTPGKFVVPPPKAEEMYFPETFGRGASARVIVE